ncbi:expressed unknown protein [Seminavis robusta]|uniref:Uncharacterized protein n=1 Tax=Seminavis robusta TaxID=568900 RepID=A0A9N8H8R9_9STRA|nr:expressed unknown protein [Seminavis robusta]|eukprot:Sro249_g098800.1 n/a (137) ;mRNA; f:61960-62370
MWTKRIAGMPTIMEEHGNNILAFNDNVRSIQKQLLVHTRGENPSFLIPQLVSVYMDSESEDSPFYRYIEQLENSYLYNDGADLTTVKADQKYKDLLEKDQIKGNTKKDIAIVALTTKGGRTQGDARGAQGWWSDES